MKIVVTGSSGKAGRAVIGNLLEHDHDVHAVDIVPPGASTAPFLLADLTEFGQTLGCLAGAEAVVHLAAFREASMPARTCLRDSPRSLGPGPIGK